MKVRSDHRSKFSNLSSWKEEACKNQGFNGIYGSCFPEEEFSRAFAEYSEC